MKSSVGRRMSILGRLLVLAGFVFLSCGLLYFVAASSIGALSAELSRVQNTFGVLSRASSEAERGAYGVEVALYRAINMISAGYGENDVDLALSDAASLLRFLDLLVAEMCSLVVHACNSVVAAAALPLAWGSRAIGGIVRVAALAFGSQAVQVGLPQLVVVPAEVVEQIPGVEPAVVTIAEHRPDRVIADGLDAFDFDFALADLQGFLPRSVAPGLS